MGRADRPAGNDRRPAVAGLVADQPPVLGVLHAGMARRLQRLSAETDGVRSGTVAVQAAVSGLPGSGRQRGLPKPQRRATQGHRQRPARFPPVGHCLAGGSAATIQDDLDAPLRDSDEVRGKSARFHAGLEPADRRRIAPRRHDRQRQGGCARQGRRQAATGLAADAGRTELHRRRQLRRRPHAARDPVSRLRHSRLRPERSRTRSRQCRADGGDSVTAARNGDATGFRQLRRAVAASEDG